MNQTSLLAPQLEVKRSPKQVTNPEIFYRDDNGQTREHHICKGIINLARHEINCRFRTKTKPKRKVHPLNNITSLIAYNTYFATTTALHQGVYLPIPGST